MVERKIRLSFLIFGILVYTVGFLAFTYQQMPEYFNKDLMSYDEATNAVVSNNIYRDFFPPRLRLNPLDEEYAGWKEGPDWQHIPPLSFYVPYPFFVLDGGPSIEVRRLSYVLLAWLQGLIFLIGISALYRRKRAIVTGIVACWAWLLTPFVRQVLNANAFGYSDIVLSFSVVTAVIAGLWYVQGEFRTRRGRELFLLLTIFLATMAIMVKNVLGALPLALLIGYLWHERKSKKAPAKYILWAVAMPVVLLSVYFGVSLWKSPEAFRAEFFTSFAHFGDYEGWARPFYYYLTHYLPGRYLGVLFLPFLAALAYAVWSWSKRKPGRRLFVSGVFLAYFAIVFVVISIVTSKSANFLLQGYLFILFFTFYMIVDDAVTRIPALRFTRLISWLYSIRVPVVVVSLVVFGIMVYLNVSLMYELRTEPYIYQTQKQKFFEFGVLSERYLYADEQFLFVLDTDTAEYSDSTVFRDPDYWLRYYILFNSGSEARRLEEVDAYRREHDLNATIRRRYLKVYWVTSLDMLQNEYKEYEDRFTGMGKYFVMPVRLGEIPELLETG